MALLIAVAIVGGCALGCGCADGLYGGKGSCNNASAAGDIERNDGDGARFDTRAGGDGNSSAAEDDEEVS